MGRSRWRNRRERRDYGVAAPHGAFGVLPRLAEARASLAPVLELEGLSPDEEIRGPALVLEEETGEPEPVSEVRDPAQLELVAEVVSAVGQDRVEPVRAGLPVSEESASGGVVAAPPVLSEAPPESALADEPVAISPEAAAEAERLAVEALADAVGEPVGELMGEGGPASERSGEGSVVAEPRTSEQVVAEFFADAPRADSVEAGPNVRQPGPAASEVLPQEPAFFEAAPAEQVEQVELEVVRDEPTVLAGAPQAQAGESSAVAEAVAVEVAPPEDPVELAYERCRALAAEGRTVEARRAFRELLIVAPRHVRARNELALLLDAEGDPNGALAELDRALEMDPDNSVLLVNRGSILGAQGRYAAAERDLKRVLRVEPSNAEALFSLGVVMTKKGLWGEAVPHLRRAVELDPSRGAAYYYLGEALNHVDDLHGAMAAYQRAAELMPEHSRALYGLGIVYDRLGRPDDAARMYRKSREVGKR